MLTTGLRLLYYRLKARRTHAVACFTTGLRLVILV
jgi:hypothetical protein